MEYLLLGAGLQGTAIAFDLLAQVPDTTRLTAFDGRQEALDALAARLPDARLQTVCGDVRDEAVLAPLMAEADVVISAVNYWYNAQLTALAIAGGAHFLDLGGNNDVVARQFEQDAAARAAGVAVVPDCGLAPGLAGILGYHLVEQLDRTESLKLRVGGLPAEPRPPLNYKLVFSVQGLINEYIEPAQVIREGRLQTVPSLSELEHLTFPEPFGELEAFQTSGGTSTLPQTLDGRVPNLDYKTIRYKGHCAQIRLLHELGLTDSRPLDLGDVQVAPRQVLAHLLERKLDLPGEDVVLLLVEAEGWDTGGAAVRRTLRIIDRHDRDHNISAMARMTGYPVAIIARLLATGKITAIGACRQELIVPGAVMIEELRRRGVDVSEETSAPSEPPA